MLRINSFRFCATPWPLLMLAFTTNDNGLLQPASRQAKAIKFSILFYVNSSCVVWTGLCVYGLCYRSYLGPAAQLPYSRCMKPNASSNTKSKVTFMYIMGPIATGFCLNQLDAIFIKTQNDSRPYRWAGSQAKLTPNPRLQVGVGAGIGDVSAPSCSLLYSSSMLSALWILIFQF